MSTPRVYLFLSVALTLVLSLACSSSSSSSAKNFSTGAGSYSSPLDIFNDVLTIEGTRVYFFKNWDYLIEDPNVERNTGVYTFLSTGGDDRLVLSQSSASEFMNAELLFSTSSNTDGTFFTDDEDWYLKYTANETYLQWNGNSFSFDFADDEDSVLAPTDKKDLADKTITLTFYNASLDFSKGAVRQIEFISGLEYRFDVQGNTVLIEEGEFTFSPLVDITTYLDLVFTDNDNGSNIALNLVFRNSTSGAFTGTRNGNKVLGTFSLN